MQIYIRKKIRKLKIKIFESRKKSVQKMTTDIKEEVIN